MAAIFDQFGNYAGDDGMGDSTPVPVPKPVKQPVYAQIPVPQRPARPANQLVAYPSTADDFDGTYFMDSGERAAETQRLLARYPAPKTFYDRPLVGAMSPRQMVGKAIQKGFEAKDVLGDIGRIGVSLSPAAIIPTWQAIADAGITDLSKAGSQRLYSLFGDQENAARVAKEREQQPSINELMQKYYGKLQPKTPGGQAIMEPVYNVLQNLPVVPAGPRGSGFVASGQRRPMLTPNDARAILGETGRVATQVRDIPTDFANAQSGFRRIDPITNKPTYGVKLQSAAASVGDTMQRRKEQGLNPIPGVPDAFVPDTQLYAVRPDKSVAIVPKVPPTVSADARVGPFDEQRQRAMQMLDALDLGDKQQTARQYTNRYIQMAPREVKQALKDFNEAELRQMFPDIADIEDAKAAAETLYSDPVAKEQRQRDLLNRFAEAHPQFKLPTFDEHQQRVNAVQTMIQDEYVPWISKHAGTPSDPQLLLAQEGKTVMEPEKLLEKASDSPLTGVAERNRVAAGFPAKGTTYHKRLQLQVQLDQAKEAAAASFEIVAAQEAATGPGQQTRILFPDYKANQAQAEKDAAVVKDLEQKVENTSLGIAYEDLVDQLVTPYIANVAQSQVMPRMQQFYPKLMKQGADQPVYSVGSGTMDTMALGTKIAEDIMAGKIPLDVVPKLKDFTPLARKYGEAQAQAYAARKEADKNFVVNANTRLKGVVDQIPQERRFDKLGAIFFDSSMPIEQVNKLASDDTALLNHCIGEAGSVDKKTRNKLTGRQHGWIPMYNVATGELEPKATRSNTRYAEKIANGNYVVASLRDTETGYPITTIGWQALGNGKWATEYLSGFNNSEAINPEYHKSIKDFLNNVAEGNAPLGVSNFKIDAPSDLQNRYNLFDKANNSSMGFARATLGTAEKEALKANPDILQKLPRFFDKNDFKQAIASPTPSADAPDNVRALMQARSILAEELDNLYGSAPISEIQTMVDDINHEIADIDARLARVQSQPVAAPAAQRRQAPTSITRDDVVRTLVETQLAIDPEAVGLQNLVFSGAVDFDPNNPLQSLRDMREYLTRHVSDTINNNQAPDRTIDALNAVVSNGMIPRLNELIAELSPTQQPDVGLLQQARDAYFPLIGNAHPFATRTYITDIYRALADITEQHAGNEPFGDTTARLIQVLANARQNINDNTQARLNVGTNNADYIDNVLGTAQSQLEQQQFIQQQQRQPAPVAPVPQLTRRQEIARDRAPQIARLFIEFSDPPLETPAQLRNLAARLYDPRDARDAAHNIAGVGDSLGNLILRASDYQRPNLVEVGRALNERADLLEQEQFIQQQQRQVPVANTGLTQETINSIRSDVASAFEIDEGPVWRREVMPIFRQYWDPTAPLTSIANMMSGITEKLRNINLSQGNYWVTALGGPEAVRSFVNGLQDLHQGLENIHDNTREIAAQGNLQSALNTPQARMAQITREQADVMPYAELAAAVGDPTQYDPIVARAMREIRMNESPASEVVDNIIGGGQIGNHDLSMMSAVERELIARDVSDGIRMLEAARAAPRNTPRQQMVSAYVNALQHEDPAVSAALYGIRNMLDDITIDGQGNGLSFNEIGGELLADISTRITSIDNRRRQGDLLQGLSRQQTASVVHALELAREQVAQAIIRNAEQQPVAQQQPPQELQPQPRTPLPSILDFVENVRRTEGLQVGDRVETVAFRVGENINPTANPLGFAQALRAAAHNEESELVEISLRELADAFEEAHIGEIVNAMEPEEWLPANRPQGPSLYIQSIQPTINNLSNDLFYMDVSPEGVPNLPAIANTIFALRNGTVDHAAFRAMPEGERQNAMNAVADDIESRTGLAAPTDQQADAFRDVYARPHGQDHVYIEDEQAGLLIDDEMRNIFRTYGQDVGERVSRIIEDMSEYMSFSDDPHGVINHLRRLTARGGSLQVRANVEQSLLDIAQRLEEEFNAAYNERDRQRMEPNPVAHLFRDMPDAELARQLSPQDQGSVEASFEAMMADNNGFAADGVPTLPAAAMLTRRFNVYDLTEPAREALARRFEAEHRDRMQLAVQPAPEVAEPQQGRSIRQLYEEFNDAIANAVEEGDFDPMEYSNADLAQFVLDDAIGGALTEITDAERQALADIVRRHGYDGDLGEDIDAPPPRRGPFQPGGSSAVRGRPLGNLNIQPAITAAALRGPDSQPVRNFLQQVRGLPGVTQEGLATGLMAFENMDPNRRMTKAEFVRELLPSSYDIVDLHGAATRNIHLGDRQMIEDMIDDDDVYDIFMQNNNIGRVYSREFSVDVVYDNLSDNLKRLLKRRGIEDDQSFQYAVDAARDELIEQEFAHYIEENDQNNLSGYQYIDMQRLVVDGMGDVYTEFGVTHPDQQGAYHHYDNAPDGMIGHIRGTYNHADPLTLRTATNDSFEAKPGYVIEEIQSDVQKGSQQKAHLHQVHGTLFKAAIQKALEFDADVVYLPTAAVIAAERHRPVKEFAPIYDQAIVKEGLKPLLKIPGVTSKMVNGYHEITFTPKAKEYILNGPGQTVPGYAKGGLVMPVSKYMGNPALAGLTYKYGGYVH